jgi:hypothetical protein
MSPLTSNGCLARCIFGGGGAAGAESRRKDALVDPRNRGGPCTHKSAMASNKLNASACIVNEANVLRRRLDWSQAASNV